MGNLTAITRGEVTSVFVEVSSNYRRRRGNCTAISGGGGYVYKPSERCCILSGFLISVFPFLSLIDDIARRFIARPNGAYNWEFYCFSSDGSNKALALSQTVGSSSVCVLSLDWEPPSSPFDSLPPPPPPQAQRARDMTAVASSPNSLCFCVLMMACDYFCVVVIML